MPGEPTLISEPTEAMLTERQRVDYHAYKREFIERLSKAGKNPERGRGYATSTVTQTS